MNSTIIDHIYEAAFVPERWLHVLSMISVATSSASGSIVVWTDSSVPVGFRTTPLTQTTLEAFIANANQQKNERAPALHPNLETCFTRVEALLTSEQTERDPIQASLRKIGLESQAATIVAMPYGERVCFSFERWQRDGIFDETTLAALDHLRPHLARAGLMAARLGLERAQSAVSAMRAMNLPAAVMTRTGRVMTTNDLFDAMPLTFLPSSHGGLAINDVEANRLFQNAIDAAKSPAEPTVRSIPIAAHEDRDAVVVHVLPLRRAAQDVFSGGDVLVVATAVRVSAAVPAPNILMGLFDLTAAEVKLAIALASGSTVQQAAIDASIQLTSARTYLDRIFRKTGTHQQSQLVALLKSAQSFTAR